MLHELIRSVLAQTTPLLMGVVLLTLGALVFLHRFHSRRITALREIVASRDKQLAEFQRTLHLSKIDQLQAKVARLHPEPRRRMTAQQQILLTECARVPEGRQFTIEIIHDMAGSDCNAYANDFQHVLKAIGGWTVSRSAVLRPGWTARCGLGIHLQDRSILSRPETIMLNALAAAGIDYDIVHIPELKANLGLLITSITANLPDFSHSDENGFEAFTPRRPAQRTKIGGNAM
jgi:hypothetical protein